MLIYSWVLLLPRSRRLVGMCSDATNINIILLPVHWLGKSINQRVGGAKKATRTRCDGSCCSLWTSSASGRPFIHRLLLKRIKSVLCWCCALNENLGWFEMSAFIVIIIEEDEESLKSMRRTMLSNTNIMVWQRGRNRKWSKCSKRRAAQQY